MTARAAILSAGEAVILMVNGRHYEIHENLFVTSTADTFKHAQTLRCRSGQSTIYTNPKKTSEDPCSTSTSVQRHAKPISTISISNELVLLSHAFCAERGLTR